MDDLHDEMDEGEGQLLSKHPKTKTLYCHLDILGNTKQKQENHEDLRINMEQMLTISLSLSLLGRS
jgi:hypothetical protein